MYMMQRLYGQDTVTSRSLWLKEIYIYTYMILRFNGIVISRFDNISVHYHSLLLTRLNDFFFFFRFVNVPSW